MWNVGCRKAKKKKKKSDEHRYIDILQILLQSLRYHAEKLNGKDVAESFVEVYLLYYFDESDLYVGAYIINKISRRKPYRAIQSSKKTNEWNRKKIQAIKKIRCSCFENGKTEK